MNKGRVRFEVTVNGEPVSTVGVESFGVLSATVCWVRRLPALMPQSLRDDPEIDEREWLKETIRLHLGGLDSVQNMNLDWADRMLEVGDEIVIRVLPQGNVPAPLSEKMGFERDPE